MIADLHRVKVRGHRPISIVATLGVLVLALAGCGGSGSSSSGGSTTDSAPKAAIGKPRPAVTGKVVSVWQHPVGQANIVGYELLKASETEYLAKSLATAFELPTPLKVKGVNGFGGGPFYSPEDNSITPPYQFATAVIGVISETKAKAAKPNGAKRSAPSTASSSPTSSATP